MDLRDVPEMLVEQEHERKVMLKTQFHKFGLLFLWERMNYEDQFVRYIMKTCHARYRQIQEFDERTLSSMQCNFVRMYESWF